MKRLKPTPADNLAGMLERAAFSAHRDVLEYLLDLGANPNDKADGGSSALEACIRHLGWEDFDRIRYHYGTRRCVPQRIGDTKIIATRSTTTDWRWGDVPPAVEIRRRLVDDYAT